MIIKYVFEGGASAEVFKSEAPNQEDFWSQLQRDWDKAAEENPSLGWLKETPLDSFSDVKKLLRHSGT